MAMASTERHLLPRMPGRNLVRDLIKAPITRRVTAMHTCRSSTVALARGAGRAIVLRQARSTPLSLQSRPFRRSNSLHPLVALRSLRSRRLRLPSVLATIPTHLTSLYTHAPCWAVKGRVSKPLSMLTVKDAKKSLCASFSRRNHCSRSPSCDTPIIRTRAAT